MPDDSSFTTPDDGRAAVAEPPGMIGLVAGMVRDGRLPPPGACAICGEAADEMIWIHLDCEHEVPLPPRVVPLRHPLFGRLSSLFIRREALSIEEPRSSREVIPLDVPLRVHHECWRERPWSHGARSLRMLLQLVPDYARLLAEYPFTRIEGCDPVDG